ncbi:hypothetical protein JHW43_002429 [Diplocarpon mali]|nr:hypothetical protein JHW43_002429 [Diplocarpon mali]
MVDRARKRDIDNARMVSGIVAPLMMPSPGPARGSQSPSNGPRDNRRNLGSSSPRRSRSGLSNASARPEATTNSLFAGYRDNRRADQGPIDITEEEEVDDDDDVVMTGWRELPGVRKPPRAQTTQVNENRPVQRGAYKRKDESQMGFDMVNRSDLPRPVVSVTVIPTPKNLDGTRGRRELLNDVPSMWWNQPGQQQTNPPSSHCHQCRKDGLDVCNLRRAFYPCTRCSKLQQGPYPDLVCRNGASEIKWEAARRTEDAKARESGVDVPVPAIPRILAEQSEEIFEDKARMSKLLRSVMQPGNLPSLNSLGPGVGVFNEGYRLNDVGIPRRNGQAISDEVLAIEAQAINGGVPGVLYPSGLTPGSLAADIEFQRQNERFQGRGRGVIGGASSGRAPGWWDAEQGVRNNVNRAIRAGRDNRPGPRASAAIHARCMIGAVTGTGHAQRAYKQILGQDRQYVMRTPQVLQHFYAQIPMLAIVAGDRRHRYNGCHNPTLEHHQQHQHSRCHEPNERGLPCEIMLLPCMACRLDEIVCYEMDQPFVGQSPISRFPQPASLSQAAPRQTTLRQFPPQPAFFPQPSQPTPPQPASRQPLPSIAPVVQRRLNSLQDEARNLDDQIIEQDQDITDDMDWDSLASVYEPGMDFKPDGAFSPVAPGPGPPLDPTLPRFEPYREDRHAFPDPRPGLGIGGNVERGNRPYWEADRSKAFWDDYLAMRPTPSPDVEQRYDLLPAAFGQITVPIPYHANNLYPQPGDNVLVLNVRPTGQNTPFTAANRPLDHWATYIYDRGDGAFNNAQESTGFFQWPFRGIERIADSHVHNPDEGLSNAQACKEHAYAGDDIYNVTVNLGLCSKVPTKACEVAPNSGINASHQYRPWFTCSDCRNEDVPVSILCDESQKPECGLARIVLVYGIFAGALDVPRTPPTDTTLVSHRPHYGQIGGILDQERHSIYGTADSLYWLL